MTHCTKTSKNTFTSNKIVSRGWRKEGERVLGPTLTSSQGRKSKPFLMHAHAGTFFCHSCTSHCRASASPPSFGMFPVVTSVMSHRFHQGIFLHIGIRHIGTTIGTAIAAIAAIAIRAVWATGGLLRRRGTRVHLFRLVGERTAVGRVGFERGFGPFLIHKDLVGAWPNQRKNGEKWQSPTTNTYQTLKEVQKLFDLSGRLLGANKDRGLGRNNAIYFFII